MHQNSFLMLIAGSVPQLELCYAPPYGGAKDPVNFAGMVGQVRSIQIMRFMV